MSIDTSVELANSYCFTLKYWLIPIASGKSGANIGRIKEETLVDIKIPHVDSTDSTKIRIEGPKEGVLKAQEMLQVGRTCEASIL